MAIDDPILPEEDDAEKERKNRDKEKDRDSASRRKKVQELEKALEEISGQKMLIVIKGPPDPDSIASAWAHKFICQHFNVESQILYFDPISHAENRALVKTLEVEMLQYKAGVDLSDYSTYSIVDAPSEEFPAQDALPKDTPLFSLVDHHKKTGKVKAKFIDIRENIGATCSIYSEYLQYGTATLSQNRTEDTSIATALHHGIRTDTDNFLLAREMDWLAAAYLSRFADRDILRIIACSPIPANMMDILQKSLQNKEIRDHYIFAGVHYVREVDRDGIAQAADYLVRREGIDTVVVFGIVEDQYIHGSLRTRSSTIDPDAFLKDVLGSDKETGRSYGGGRLDKGGFQIPLSIFGSCSDKDLLWQLVAATIKEKFMKKLGVL